MAKNDFGRLRNRGANNGRLTIGNTEPEDPIINDIWLNPDIKHQHIDKTVTEGIASTTTVQNDDALQAYLGAGGTYEVFLNLAYYGAGGCKVDWDVTGDYTELSNRSCRGPDSSSTDPTNTNMRTSHHNYGTDISYGSHATTYASVQERFTIQTGTATASVQVRWAQVTSSATRLTVSVYSYLKITPLNGLLNYYDGAQWVNIL